MEGITLKLSGTLLGPLEKMQEEIPIAEKKALYTAAFYLKDKIKESINLSIPKATQRNPKYSDTLVDAVRFTSPDGASVNINAMGNRKPSSGTYRTRFFEDDTRDRYQKTYKGQKLKKKRYLGHITGTHFFKKGVDANKDTAVRLMEEVLSEYIEKTIINTP